MVQLSIVFIRCLLVVSHQPALILVLTQMSKFSLLPRDTIPTLHSGVLMLVTVQHQGKGLGA